jgi:putative peptidoglycan lipid II flippase
VTTPDAGGRALLRSAGVISSFTFLSRLLGLVRDQLFAALVGAGHAGIHADAFNVAFRIPNLLRDLFAEGALSAAFVPTYARTLREGGRAAAFALASRLMNLLAVVIGGLVILGFVFAEAIVRLLAPGYAEVPGKLELTVELTRLMLPFLMLVSFAAVAMGILNAHERYSTPAVAPAIFNLVTIVWAGLLWAMGLGPREVVVGWAIGTVLGGAGQFLAQVPGLWREGWRPRLQWAPRDPGLGAIARLMGPATVGLASVQLNIFISTNFASHEQGAVTWLQLAFRILYLPIGIFGVAVGTIATTGLAHRAAADDVPGMRQTLNQSLRALAFLTLPATAGLMVLAQPIVRLLFERGRFQPADTLPTAAALVYYAIGLVAYTGVKVLAPAFYALGRPRIPLLASASAVATNLVVIALLHGMLGFRAIALGTALGSMLNVIVLAVVLERRLGGLIRPLLSADLLRMLLAAAVMAGLAAVCAWGLELRFGTRGFRAQLLTGLLPVAAGTLVYGLVSRLLGIPEARALLGLIRRRMA